MSELDPRTLRRALAAPEGAPDADTADIATIIGRGRALRRRRRFAAAAGGACAAAALFGALTAITHLTRPATAPAQYPAVSGRGTPARHPVPSRSPRAIVSTPAPGATPTAGPSTALPNTAGPNTAGPATAGPATAGPGVATAYPSPSPTRSLTAAPAARAVAGVPSPMPGR